MIIPITVLIVGFVFLLVRWTWQTMKRSNDPAVQEAVETFSAQVDELRQALIRLGTWTKKCKRPCISGRQ